MKNILISIHPKWCELIASGKKTVEVRKTRPKIDTPFKCYIYATKTKTRSHPARIYNSYIMPESGECGNGKVIGEFLCHNIEEFESDFDVAYLPDAVFKISNTGSSDMFSRFRIYVSLYGKDNYLLDKSCLSWEELRKYVGNGRNTFYGYSISDLKIYDRPKELSEFWTIKCTNKKGHCSDCKSKPDCIKRIIRPPQSWCYVE